MEDHTYTAPLATVAVRFVPHDQWLVTHLDPDWKIKQVKLWILSKCIPSYANLHAQTKAPEPVPDPPRHRPASPITFAPDPRHRPISPIMFASRNRTTRTDSNSDEDDSEDGSVYDLYDEALGYGYEEDDEYDPGGEVPPLTDEVPFGSVYVAPADVGGKVKPGHDRYPHYREHRIHRRRHASSISSIALEGRPNVPHHTLSNQSSNISNANSSSHTTTLPAPYPTSWTLIRFSTGQILEDDFTLCWYNLQPYELLEVHRGGIVLRLPRQIPSEYVQPYWEGWVRALRVVWRDHPHNHRNSQQFQRHDSHYPDQENRRTTLEWRPRWVVIREGMLTLCKDSKDATPSQILSLSSLTALRGAEHLAKTMHMTGQHIVCAKFKVKVPAARFVSETPSHLSVNPSANVMIGGNTITSVVSVGNPRHSTSSLVTTHSSKSKMKLTVKPNPNTGPYMKHKSSVTSYNKASKSGSTHSQNNLNLLRAPWSSNSNPLSQSLSKPKQDFPGGGLRNKFVGGGKKKKDKGKKKEFDSGDEEEEANDTDTTLSSPVFATVPSPGGLTSDADSQRFWDEGVALRGGDPTETGVSNRFGFGREKGRRGFVGKARRNAIAWTDDESDGDGGEADVDGEGDEMDGDFVAISMRNRRHARGESVGVGIALTDRDTPGNSDRDQMADTAKPKEKEGGKETGEWIVMDMGDDNAYNSILRILHRHFPPPISSSFIAAIPALSAPSFTLTTSSQDVYENDTHYEPSFDTQPSSPTSSRDPLIPTPAPAQSSFELQLPAKHPASLANMSRSLSATSNANIDNTFGALPYPEWRMDIVARAQKAGIGEVGKPMEWVLWGINQDDALWSETDSDVDLDINRGGTGEALRRRRKERRMSRFQDDELGAKATSESPNRKRKSRQSQTSTITPTTTTNQRLESVRSHSDGSDDVSADDTGDESSEAEWQGWVADLQRQNRVWQKKQMAQQAAILTSMPSDPQDQHYSMMPEGPQAHAYAQRIFQEGRRALEPSAVVTSRDMHPVVTVSTPHVPLPAPPIAHASSTAQLPTSKNPPILLSSPSSSESLSRPNHKTRLSFGVSPGEVPSTTASTTSSPPFSSHTIPYAKEPPSNSTLYTPPPLYGGAFIQPTPRPTPMMQEPSPRRPKVPIIPLSSLAAGPGAIAIGPARPSKSASTTPAGTPGSTSPVLPVSSSIPFSPSSHAFLPPSLSRGSSPSRISAGVTNVGRLGMGPMSSVTAGQPIPRRASTAGIVGMNTVNKSPIVISRSGVLKKKEGEAGKELRDQQRIARDRERAKEKEEWKARESTRDSGKRRPKLSVATSSPDSHEALIQPQPPPSPTVSTKKSLLRRVRSGSSLRSVDAPHSQVDGGQALGSRKKNGLSRGPSVAERFVRGLDSALDFVEGK